MASLKDVKIYTRVDGVTVTLESPLTSTMKLFKVSWHEYGSTEMASALSTCS